MSLRFQTNLVPEVGMGASVQLWSDRYPATVTAVSKTGKTVTLTEDEVTEWKNDYGVAFKANPQGRTYEARQIKGVWKILRSGYRVAFGTRSAYRDPHF